MKIRIRKKKLKDKRESLYLDYYKDGERYYEFLKLYIERGNPNNKETMRLAEKIKAERMLETDFSRFNKTNPHKKNQSFIEYYEKFLSTKEKWSNYHGAFKHLKNFVGKDLKFKQINEAWFKKFSDYLTKEAGLKPNSSFIYFRKIKEVLYKASAEDYIDKRLVKDAKNPKRGQTKRGYLELDELQKLIETESDRPEIKSAFLFSCFTGLRQSDIRNLKWKNISDNSINFTQQKTNDSIKIPLSKTALNILNSKNVFGFPETKIFNLPKDRATINRTLTRWFKKAGIDKKAFYHLSRHTFATLNLTFGNEIYTVSKLLGHKSLKTTEIYANIIDEKKKQAIDNLPVLEVSK